MATTIAAHCACARTSRSCVDHLLTTGVLVDVLVKEIEQEQRAAMNWHEKFKATRQELQQLKEHVKQAEWSTRTVINELQKQVRAYEVAFR